MIDCNGVNAWHGCTTQYNLEMEPKQYLTKTDIQLRERRQKTLTGLSRLWPLRGLTESVKEENLWWKSQNLLSVTKVICQQSLNSNIFYGTWLFKLFKVGNRSRVSDKNLVLLEFKYLQNKKWLKQAVKSARIKKSYRTYWPFSFYSDD